ncbi:mechanosensitive ion channel [Klebsiella pneumoniae]|nr:mechanosensitive ion channel [Klebsiella pneumoniae]
MINWSLSDTVTRVVIRLGVAYGSDLDKVKEVLLKAAHDHPKVDAGAGASGFLHHLRGQYPGS